MTSQISLGAQEPQLRPTSAFRNVLILVVTTVALATLVFVLLVPHVRQRLIAVKKGALADLTEMAVGILAHYDRLAAEGQMTMAEAQQAALAHLRGIRFGTENQGYFWINDRSPRLLMHPHRTELEGRDVGELTDADGQRIFADGVAAAAGPEGAGFITYRWPVPQDAAPALPKISHMRLYPPWGWIVGGGAYLQDIDRQIAGLKTRLALGGLAVTVVVGLIVALLTWEAVKTERSRRSAWSMLRKRQEEHRAVLESSPHPIVVYDLKGRAVYVNPAFSRTFGWSAEEVLGQRIDFVPEDEREKTLAGVARAYAEGYATLESRRLTRDGRQLHVHVSAAAFRDETGAAVGQVVNIVDITDRREAEEALRESEQKYRNLVENASDAIFVTQDGVIKFPNRRMIEVSGYDARALASLSFVDLIHPDDRPLIAARHQKRLQGEPVPDTVSFRGYDRAGRLMWLELNAVTVEWEGRPAVLNFLRDVSERKRLETEIQQAQRLESLATLAGGVAHEFNNLLMGIMGNTALMRLDLNTAHPHWKRLEDIEHNVYNGAELTKQLLGFARGARFTLEPSDLNRVVQDAVSLFRERHREARLDCRLQADLWPVVMDCGQIGDVLRNLLANAQESMPDGGNVVVATANVTLCADEAGPRELAPGRYARVAVSDTGIGMDEATRGRVFEPFFTTRHMGNGAGLGLAAAYGTVRGHGGLLTVTSQQGAGATFEVYLPAGDPARVIEPV
jgi:PAS domain S-box-containing protein